MNEYTAPFTVQTLAFDALPIFVPELRFRDLANIEPGPYVYALVAANGAIAYWGKSSAQSQGDGRRAFHYQSWSADYLAEAADAGLPDPMHDPMNGNLELARWSPIVRFVTAYGLTVKVASVVGTDATAEMWEARLQALAGTLTSLESAAGGSVWEANAGTKRGDGYAWACERILQLRAAGQR